MAKQLIDIKDYCQRLQSILLSEFGERICYIGLQGSYLRGEANENSDIDIMVILDNLTIKDMDLYQKVLEMVGNKEKACGFICSKTDMQNWNPLEICQLKHTTKDIFGVLEDFLPKWSITDEVNYIKISLNNLYHALCHGYIHGNKEKRIDKIIPFYKSAFFILQNTYFLDTYRSDEHNAKFVLSKNELLNSLQGEDKTILETLQYLINGGKIDYNKHFELLLHWCQNKMANL